MKENGIVVKKHYICRPLIKLKMYAIVEIAGQQFKVVQDQKLFVHRLADKEGAKVSFEKVYLLDDGKKVTLGAPAIILLGAHDNQINIALLPTKDNVGEWRNFFSAAKAILKKSVAKGGQERNALPHDILSWHFLQVQS